MNSKYKRIHFKYTSNSSFICDTQNTTLWYSFSTQAYEMCLYILHTYVQFIKCIFTAFTYYMSEFVMLQLALITSIL